MWVISRQTSFLVFGELKYSDGGKYSGQWLQGMKEGQATMAWANGGSYVGAYVKDKRCGYGVMRYATGGTFAGDWAADMKHGHGVFTNTDGTTVVGMWNNDKPVVGGGGSEVQVGGALILMPRIQILDCPSSAPGINGTMS